MWVKIMANAFDSELGEKAIERLERYGKTNIRYEMVERFGTEQLAKDLSEKVGYACSVRIAYDSHEPMDLFRYFYCGDTTYTVRVPVMPIVIIEKKKK